MREIFYFESMLTPKIITFAYWLLLLIVCVAGLGTILGGGMSFGKFLMGIAIIVLGAFFSRIWCELLIVLFKIDENIKKIADK